MTVRCLCSVLVTVQYWTSTRVLEHVKWVYCEYKYHWQASWCHIGHHWTNSHCVMSTSSSTCHDERGLTSLYRSDTHYRCDTVQVWWVWHVAFRLVIQCWHCSHNVTLKYRTATPPNRLQLNAMVLWSTSVLPCQPLLVWSDAVKPVRCVWDLRVYIDADLPIRTHVSKTVSSCFAALC